MFIYFLICYHVPFKWQECPSKHGILKSTLKKFSSFSSVSFFSVCPSHRCRLKMSPPNTSSSGREGNRRQVWKERQTWLDHESRLQHRHRPIPVHYSSGSSWRRQLLDSTQNKPHVTTVHIQTMRGQLAIFMSSNLLVYFVLAK